MEKQYNTKQKSIILATLEKYSDNYFTAEALSELLKKLGYEISRATLFRSLDNFSKNGYIKKFYTEDSQASNYQYIKDGCLDADHIHLMCTDCGKLIHADLNSVKRVDNEVLKKYGFDINENKTLLYGVCSECKEKHHEEA